MAGRTVAVRLEARISAYQAAGPQDGHEAPTVSPVAAVTSLLR